MTVADNITCTYIYKYIQVYTFEQFSNFFSYYFPISIDIPEKL